MRILVLTDDFPATTRMPGASRLFNLCREIAHSHTVTLALFPSSPGKEMEFYQDPDTEGVFSKIVKLPGSFRPRSTPAWWRCQLHRLSLQPCFSQLCLYPDQLHTARQAVNDIIEENDIDLLFVNGLCMSQFVDCHLPGEVPLVVDLCDCLSFLYAQEAKIETRLRRKIAIGLEALGIALSERALSRRASLLTLTSPVDREQLLRVAPRAKCLVIPLGIDADFFTAAPARSRVGNGPRLLFTGVMAYVPNADAVQFFAHDILPLVHRRFPEAEFWIVGANPPASVQALAAIPGVHVTGEVKDIREHLAAADIFVCPLRYGAGVKNKILSALSMELPVIATPVSLYGLETQTGVHLLSAETPEEFVDKIALLEATPNLAAQLRQNGRQFVTAHCSWAVQGERLAAALGECLRNPI
jgi:glycosyltransferase involved in cell wall biosynthesis